MAWIGRIGISLEKGDMNRRARDAKKEQKPQLATLELERPIRHLTKYSVDKKKTIKIQ